MASQELTNEFEKAIEAFVALLHAEYIDLGDESACARLAEPPIPVRIIVAASPYALGRILLSGEDVHLVCVTRNTSGIFWDVFRESFQLSPKLSMAKAIEDGVVELSSSELSIDSGKEAACLRTFVRLARLDQLCVKTYLHFCRLLGELPMYHLATGSLDDNFHRPDHHTSGLTLAMEAQRVATRPGNTKRAFNTLYTFNTTRGLMGFKFGFLGAATLVEIAREVSSRVPWEQLRGKPDECAQTVLTHYKRLMWECCHPAGSAVLEKPHVSPSTMNIRDILKEKLTPEARNTIVAAISAESISTTTNLEVNKDPTTAFEEFLTDYPDLLLVEAESWAPTVERRSTFQIEDVPRNVNKVVEAVRKGFIQRFAIHSLRIWPEAKAHHLRHDQQRLVIGIKIKRGANADEKFEKNIHDFENHIEENILDYDRTIGLIALKPITVADVYALFSKLSLNDTNTDNQPTRARYPPLDPSNPFLPASLSTSKKPRFRTARSAMSRLIHDPLHRDGDFLIGYKDRFSTDLVWMRLREWVGKETEDLDFVPEHRVWQIKQVNGPVLHEDGTVLWDREQRLDLT